MKRKQGRDISSFFSKGTPNENQVDSNSPIPPTQPSQQNSSPLSTNPPSQNEELELGATSHTRSQIPTPLKRLTEMEIKSLPQDPGKRRNMSDFHKDDRDYIRRFYIDRGLCQPVNHDFPFREFRKSSRRFNPIWFEKYYTWIEYSVEKDAAFCFVCYLFKKDNEGSDAFVSEGFRTWSKPDALNKHVGGHMSTHHKAMMGLVDFKNQNVSLPSAFSNQTQEMASNYRRRLEASVKCLKYLLLQALSFCGHLENSDSLNQGNFLELLKFHAKDRIDVEKVVLENAPGNCQMTAPCIQKDIIHACAKETTKAILEEIDISDKEQMAICLRYIDRKGGLKERFLGLVHVPNTTSLTLKEAIESLLMEHSLSLSRVRGQGYDGASNMRGAIAGLKTLITDEYPQAYYVHCFAHQLQLTLVAVAKKNSDCSWLFLDVLPLLLNFVGGSPKRKKFLRQSQKTRVVEALSSGEIESGTGLNQEKSLSRPGDTRWGSHFKTIVNVLDLYRPILESLDVIVESSIKKADKNKACAIINLLMSFDFVFVAYLMTSIFAITHELNLALQKRDQDIVNAMTLVDVTKRNLQKLRDSGWDAHVTKVSSFLAKHDIEILNMEGMYVAPGRRMFRGNTSQVTNLHHFRVQVFLSVIDQRLQEIDNRFSEKSKELLICMSCFDPTNRFVSYDKEKLIRLAEFYPNDFSSAEMFFFEHSLDNFIEDVRNDERFWNVKTLNELSIKLVETKKHETHSKVYLLLKLVLILPVATASVERAFSSMTMIKNKLRNSMGDGLLNDCLVTFLEKDLFCDVEVDAIVNRFQNLRTRREQL